MCLFEGRKGSEDLTEGSHDSSDDIIGKSDVWLKMSGFMVYTCRDALMWGFLQGPKAFILIGVQAAEKLFVVSYLYFCLGALSGRFL